MYRTLQKLTNWLAMGSIALLLAGCTTPTGEANHTGTGALIGGLSGASLGAAVAHHDPGVGALFGGALGAITGGIIGNSMDQAAHPPVYVAAPPPQPHYVWVNGQWQWSGNAWVWIPEHWALVP